MTKYRDREAGEKYLINTDIMSSQLLLRARYYKSLVNRTAPTTPPECRQRYAGGLLKPLAVIIKSFLSSQQPLSRR